MRVGTIPLIIHVPEMAPIRKSMRIAVPIELMFPVIASSNFFQGTWHTIIAIATQTVAPKRRATWLAPSRASAPKKRITKKSAAISTTKGTSDNPHDGVRSSFLAVLFFKSLKDYFANA